MGKTQRKKANKNIKNSGIKNSLYLEIWGISVICISIVLIVGVYFKSGGFLGNMLNIFLKGIFGIGAYLLPIILISFCISMLLSQEKKINLYKLILTVIIFTLIIGLFHIFSKQNTDKNTDYITYLASEYKLGGALNGGAFGAIIGDIFLKLIGKATSIILIITVCIALIFLLMGKSFFRSIYKWYKNIKTYFYYEELIEEEKEEEEEEEEKEQYNVKKRGKLIKSIFNIIRKKDKEYEYEDEYEDEKTKYEKPIARANNTQDIIRKYTTLKEPKFFEMNTDRRNANRKISLATDEIKNPLLKNTQNTYDGAMDMQDVNITYENNLYEDDMYHKFMEKENKNIINTEKNINKKYSEEEPSFKIQSKEEFINNVYKKKKKTLDIPIGVISSVDVDLENNNTNIDEMFDIPPEQYLYGYINEDELKKIDRFYDFQDIENIEKDTDENIEKTQKNVKYEGKASDIEKTIQNKKENIQNSNIRPILAPIETEEKKEKIKKIGDGYTPIVKQQAGIYKEPPKAQEDEKAKEKQNINEPTIIKAQEEKLVKKGENEQKEQKEYVFPKLKFLNRNNYIQSDESDQELRKNSYLLMKTLKSFNVEANVINISKGPSVTRYELSIEDGIKVSKILGLSDNLALSLAAQSIRIEAPIPGKSAVGIEIPNKEVRSVFLSEVLCSRTFQEAESRLSFGLGKDITGNVIVTDIAKMPHMLIAGATGSGKSVCINTLISSILYKASPNDVKLMMIDPKVVELSIYNGIPHLLTPVVTDPEKASGVLNWAVSEMMERYELFSKTSTRNLTGYNEICEKNDTKKLPQIVIIIDELADLMMVAAKEVEASICRLAQLARAAGIHLIIATQRPSVDVITGLIKANIPSRIAFAVSSGTDSRTVLDTVGAEKLLGKGDMLFKSVNMSKPLRIQGAFISDKEVETIVSFIKENADANYDDSIITKIEKNIKPKDGGADGQSDELIDDVIGFLVKKKKASTSLVQRQFRIGYNRAARIIEELEDRGIISEEQGSKQRDVLMDKYQYEEYLNRYDNY